MNKTQLFAKLKKELNITKFIPIAGLSNDNYLLDNKYVNPLNVMGKTE